MDDDHQDKPKLSLRRRDLLRVITTIPAAALIPLTPAAVAQEKKAGETATKASTGAPAAYQPRALNPHEWETAHVLSDIIIPADERSGSASQAGVPEFIDDWLDFKGGEVKAEIRGGLTWLDMECNRKYGHDFIDCTETEKKEILDRIAYPKKAAPEDANAVAFFNHFRDLVVSGFYSSEMGVKDLPYLGNTMVTDWEGCPHDALVKLGLAGGGNKG
jgi:gluconate 2-dehydrogenase gamma chain